MDKKSITIIGKNNIDKLSKKPSIRCSSQKWKDKYEIINSKDIDLLSKLCNNIEFDGAIEVKNELNKKIEGYKNQDIKKNIDTSENLITYDELLNKLMTSDLKCYYCKKDVKLMYTDVRDNEQWTLDRLNNDMGHTNNNTVICDLKCNLQRRCQSDELFLYSKRLKIIKTE